MKTAWFNGGVRVLIAFALSILCTSAIGFHLGAPADPQLAEERIRAFYEASYRDGKLIGAHERDRILREKGYDFSPPAESASLISRSVALLNWYPAIFGLSLAAFLLLVRPRLRGAGAGIVGGSLVALFAGPSAGLASALALGCYLLFELAILRRAESRRVS